MLEDNLLKGHSETRTLYKNLMDNFAGENDQIKTYFQFHQANLGLIKTVLI